MQIFNFIKKNTIDTYYARLLFIGVALTLSMNASAIVGGHEYQFTDGDETVNQSRAILFQELAEELRCPKCQNQNLSDSNAMIAGDLRRELYSQVKDGKNAEQIVEFMVDRYGEFVLYRPSLNDKTIVLWYGPVVLLAFALLVFASIVFRRKSKDKNEHSMISSGDGMTAAVSDEEQKRIDELLNPSVVKATGDNEDNKGGK